MRIQVTDAGGTSYCAPLASGSGMVPWSSFIFECYNDPTTPKTPTAPYMISKVEFTVDDGATATPYNICVDAVTF